MIIYGKLKNRLKLIRETQGKMRTEGFWLNKVIFTGPIDLVVKGNEFIMKADPTPHNPEEISIFFNICKYLKDDINIIGDIPLVLCPTKNSKELCEYLMSTNYLNKLHELFDESYKIEIFPRNIKPGTHFSIIMLSLHAKFNKKHMLELKGIIEKLRKEAEIYMIVKEIKCT